MTAFDKNLTRDNHKTAVHQRPNSVLLQITARITSDCNEFSIHQTGLQAAWFPPGIRLTRPIAA